MQNNNNRGNRNPNNAGSGGNQNQAGNNPHRKDFNARKDNNPHPNYKKSNKNDFHKKPQQRFNSENYAARITSPKRDESVEDIKMDIEKLEKDIQFEVKQIRSIKLGL